MTKLGTICAMISSLADLIQIFLKYKMFVSQPNAEKALRLRVRNIEDSIDEYRKKIRDATSIESAQILMVERDRLVMELAEVRKDLKRLTKIAKVFSK